MTCETSHLSYYVGLTCIHFPIKELFYFCSQPFYPSRWWELIGGHSGVSGSVLGLFDELALLQTNWSIFFPPYVVETNVVSLSTLHPIGTNKKN